MVREYIEKAYLPQAKVLRARLADNCALAKTMRDWSDKLRRSWSSLHLGEPTVVRSGDQWLYSVPVFGGDLPLASVRVELFADEHLDSPAEVVTLHQEHAIPGTVNGHVYAGQVEALRPAEEYTIRVVPHHPTANVPAELPLIAWQR
jgi:starch phosphorylase